MMEQFPLFIFLLSLLPVISCFNCNTVLDSSLCPQLSGCLWNGTNCNGTFSPSCTLGTCYYIDPIDGSDSAAGSILDPFKTLTPGFQKLVGKSGGLIVTNYIIDMEVEILNYTLVTSNVTISRLFNMPYTLSLKNFNVSTMPSLQSSAINITSLKLEIIGCTINEMSVTPGIQTIFELGAAKLFFRDVLIYNYQGSVKLVNCDKTTSQFNYTGGVHRNSSFYFQLLSGSHIFSGIQFLDNKASNMLLYVGVTATISDVLVSGGTSLFLYLVKESTLTFQNLTFNGYSGNLIDATNTNRLTITSSMFRNINLTISTPFIRLSGAGKSYYLTHSIKNTIFQNCTVRTSLFLLEKNSQQMTMDNVTMLNINKMNLSPEDYTMDDLEYRSEWPGGICFLGRKSSALLLSNSTFVNISSHCIGLRFSSLSLVNSTFNNSDLEYSATQISEDNIDEYYGVTWLNFRSGATDVTPGISIKITSNKFYGNKIPPKFGGALRFLGMFTLALNLTSNEFVNNVALYGGAIYTDNPLLIFNSTNEIYRQNSAQKGGAIYKTGDGINFLQAKILTIIFSNGKFIENQATKKGGSLFLNYEVLKMANSSFIGCKAQDGGAIYFIQPSPQAEIANKSLQNNSFYSNYAANSGGAIKMFFEYSKLKEDPDAPSIFVNNTDFKGLAVSDGRPSHYIFSFYDLISERKFKSTDDPETWINNASLTAFSYQLNSSAYPLGFKLNHKSGHELSQIILIELLDNRNQLADYINQEGIIVGLKNSNDSTNQDDAFIAGAPISFSFTRGRLFIKSAVKIVGKPRTTATITFQGASETSNLLNDAKALIDLDMMVNFVDCEVGDIFNPTTGKCNTCEEGTYSLTDPYSNGVCVKCDANQAFCLGGRKIAPNPGYWRFDINTANILECPTAEACLGGFHDEKYFPNGLCTYPYEGNLCNKCADNYAKFGTSSKCVNCETDTMYYIKFVGFFLIQVAALLYAVKCNLSKISDVKKAHLENDKDLKEKLKNEDFQSNLMKVAVNFLQVSNIIIQYKFEWPQFIQDLIEVTNKIVPSDKDGFSVDCILALIAGKSEYVHFIKLVVVLVQPFCLWLLLILCYMCYLKFKKQPLIGNPKLRQNVIVLFVITAFIVQPTIMQSTLEIFKCQNFSSTESPVFFMIQNSETECWTSYHLFWALAVALPNFLVWTLILPLLLLRTLRSKAKDLHNPEIYARYSFVYEGLKTNKYYWEFVILARKALVVLVFVFFSFISIQCQAFVTFIIVILFASLHYICWPYSDDKLNQAEMVSLASLGVMIYCGMFFLSNGGNEWLNTVLVVFSCLFDVGFFLYLAILFIKSYRNTAKRITKKITEISVKIKEKAKLSRTGSASVTMEKKNTIDVKDLSIVLNNIEIESPKEIRHSEFMKLNRDQEESWVPGELDSPQLAFRKIVFNQDKPEIDNHSVLKSSIFRTTRSKSRQNSGGSVVPPEMLQGVIQVSQFKSSLINSYEQKSMARSFSNIEKGEEPSKKEVQIFTEIVNQND